MGLGIERRLKKELVKFARNHDNIVGITKGGNSEEGHEVYYVHKLKTSFLEIRNF